jgi:hypothetical protein
VTGTVDPALVDAVAGARVEHQRAETIVARVLTAVLSAPRRVRLRRRTVGFDDIVREDLRTGDRRPLERRAYRTAP